MVESKQINQLESLFSQMNGELSSNFSELIKKTIVETLNNNENKEEVDYNLLYWNNKEDFENWILPKFSRNYKVNIVNVLYKLFSLDIKDVLDIYRAIENKEVTQSSASKGFRVFLNYLEDKELISELDILRARKRIKIKADNTPDSYVPKKKDILETLSLLKTHEFPKEAQILYKFMLESGCRYTELEHLIKYFDESKVEEFEDIITYQNFYLRGSKSSYYLFCSKKTFKELKGIIGIDKDFLDYFKRKIQRTNHLVNLKYLRKFNFTQLIDAGVEMEFANFVQGRASKNIGFTNYLARQRLTIPKYSNFISYLFRELA
jgi:intergrase/recombinase